MTAGRLAEIIVALLILAVMALGVGTLYFRDAHRVTIADAK